MTQDQQPQKPSPDQLLLNEMQSQRNSALDHLATARAERNAAILRVQELEAELKEFKDAEEDEQVSADS